MKEENPDRTTDRIRSPLQISGGENNLTSENRERRSTTMARGNCVTRALGTRASPYSRVQNDSDRRGL